MRKKYNFIFLACLMLSTFSYSQRGVGTSNPNKSSILELKSTKKGFLIPRLTKVQRDNITNPAEGLLIYCKDCKVKTLYIFIEGEWGQLKVK